MWAVSHIIKYFAIAMNYVKILFIMLFNHSLLLDIQVSLPTPHTQIPPLSNASGCKFWSGSLSLEMFRKEITVSKSSFMGTHTHCLIALPKCCIMQFLSPSAHLCAHFAAPLARLGMIIQVSAHKWVYQIYYFTLIWGYIWYKWLFHATQGNPTKQ